MKKRPVSKSLRTTALKASTISKMLDEQRLRQRQTNIAVSFYFLFDLINIFNRVQRELTRAKKQNESPDAARSNWHKKFIGTINNCLDKKKFLECLKTIAVEVSVTN